MKERFSVGFQPILDNGVILLMKAVNVVVIGDKGAVRVVDYNGWVTLVGDLG